MARQVDIISARQGKHYILIGYDSNELASFHLQMWITKYQVRMVDFVQSMGLNFISFLGGDLWIHNQEEDVIARCNLFGEKRDCMVGVVVNEAPQKIKVLDALNIHSDAQWEVVSITIPPSLNYPNGMSSAIPTAQFKKREGFWRAKFLRNMKSTSDTASVLDAIQGEQLRGQTAYLILKNTSNDQVKLFAVDVEATVSRI